MQARVDKVGVGPAPTPGTVFVVGGDAIVGQALALLLSGAKHDARFIDLLSFGRSDYLQEAVLLLLSPGLDPKDRETLLSSIGDGSNAWDPPVMELVPTSQELRIGKRHFAVPWPCRTEDLERQIGVALIVDTDLKQASP